MNSIEHQPNGTVTGHDIRHVLGPINDDLIIAIQDTGATRDEVLQAHAWLDDEDYMGTMMQRPMNHRARAVYDILREDLDRMDRYEH